MRSLHRIEDKISSEWSHPQTEVNLNLLGMILFFRPGPPFLWGFKLKECAKLPLYTSCTAMACYCDMWTSKGDGLRAKDMSQVVEFLRWQLRGVVWGPSCLKKHGPRSTSNCHSTGQWTNPIRRGTPGLFFVQVGLPVLAQDTSCLSVVGMISTCRSFFIPCKLDPPVWSSLRLLNRTSVELRGLGVNLGQSKS